MENNVVKGCVVRAATRMDFESAVSLFTTFLRTRPVTANANDVTSEDCSKAASIFVDTSLREGNVWLVEKENKPIGYFSGWNLKVRGPGEYHPFLKNHPHFSKVHKYTETLMQRWLSLHNYTRDTLPEKHSYQYIAGGLEPEARGLGLSNPLLTYFSINVAKMGYEHCVQIASNKASIRDDRIYPTRTLACLKHADFFPGDPGFEKCTAQGHDGVYLLWDQLKLYLEKSDSKVSKL